MEIMGVWTPAHIFFHNWEDPPGSHHLPTVIGEAVDLTLTLGDSMMNGWMGSLIPNRTEGRVDEWRGPKKKLGGGFKYFLFSPISRWWFQSFFTFFTLKIGEDSNFDYISRGLKPPTRKSRTMTRANLW